MRRLIVMTVVLAALLGCARAPEGLTIPAGSEVKVVKKDGVTVAGKLVAVQDSQVVVQSRDGVSTTVRRADIASVEIAEDTVPESASSPASAAPAAVPDPSPTAPATGDSQLAEAAPPPEKPAPNQPPQRSAGDVEPPAPKQAGAPAERRPEYRDITIPAGTVLRVTLRNAVASDTSHVEDTVRAALSRRLTIDGRDVLPAGTAIIGHVTEATRSARVKGRARIAFRFTSLDAPGEGGRTDIRTGLIAREAEGTQKKDAAKIGGAAVGGAIVGGILGGGDGAAKGAAVGGAAGTGVVLSTRGKEVRLGTGTPLSVRLLQPVTVRVRE